MTTAHGKLVTIGDQQRFFPTVPRSPLGALDSAHGEHENDDGEAWRLARDAEVDAREAALDAREEEHDKDDESEEARDRKRARDTRAIARDKRAHDRRHKAKDALPDNTDHRRDFRSGDGHGSVGRRGASDGVTGDSARRGQRLTGEQEDLLAAVRIELKA